MGSSNNSWQSPGVDINNTDTSSTVSDPIKQNETNLVNKQRSASAGSSSEPHLEGWLYKWTNYIKLYQKRWFVLKQNALSYYRNPSETGLTCRGTISLLDACIQAEEGNNFVISHGNQAYHLKANNEIERQRWIMMLELAKSRQHLNQASNYNCQGTMSSLSSNTTSSSASSKQTDTAPITVQHSNNNYHITNNNFQNKNTNQTQLISARNQMSRATLQKFNSIASQHPGTTHLDSSSSSNGNTTNRFDGSIEETGSEDEDGEYQDKISPIRDVLETSTQDLSKKLVNLKQQALVFNECISRFANSLLPLYNHVEGLQTTSFPVELQDPATCPNSASLSSTPTTLAKRLCTSDPNDQHQVFSEILKNADEVQETLDRLTNLNYIYVSAAEEHQRKWKKSIVREESNRTKLEDLVEQLARQQSEYEEEFFDAEESCQDSIRMKLSNDNLIGKKLSACMRSKSKSSESILSDVIDNNGNETSDNCKSSSHLNQATITKQMSIVDHSISIKEVPGTINQCQDNQLPSNSGENLEVIPGGKPNYSVDKIDFKEISENSYSSEKDITITASQTVMQKTRRETIPYRLNQSLNLWSILKNCMGKELTKIPIPVNFNEPLSMLQRLTEDYEYADELLHPAAKLKDPLEQMVYVAVFAVSSYSTTSNRTGKPFNPLLGETYECDRMDDLGWKCINEQVSHHPPMMASYCQGQGWVSWREFGMSSKFRGKYLQVTPQDINCLEMGSNIYVWKKVDTCVHNIIVGKLWVDHEGEMIITNHTTGDKCKLKFWPYSYFSREVPKKVSGFVFDKNDRPQWLIDGTWDHDMKFSKVISTKSDKNGCQTVQTTESKTLWRRRFPGPEYERMYNMTKFAVQLNELEDKIAPTDSRLRPDQRLMEMGKWDESNRAKCQLEEKQRSARRLREIGGETARNNNSDKITMKGSSNSLSILEGIEAASKLDDSSNQGNENCCFARSHRSSMSKDGTTHSPLDGPFWFEKKLDPITKRQVHKYRNEYWQCKEREDWSRCPDIF